MSMATAGGDHPKVAFDFQKFANDTKGIFAEKYLEYVLGPRPHSRRQVMLEQLFVFAAVRALTAWLEYTVGRRWGLR